MPGVEYVYSTSSPGSSLVIARFLVGTPQDDALVRVYSRIYANKDRLPQGSSQPMIQERSIDDVPVLALTLWGEKYDAVSPSPRRCGARTHHQAGGQRIGDAYSRRAARTMRVILSNDKLAAYAATPAGVIASLQAANARVEAGQFASGNQEFGVDAGNFFERKEDLEQVVVGVYAGRPIYLRDVAEQIVDGPAEPTDMC